MSLAERRGLRLFTFCALYCAQGIPWGFMAFTLPAYVAARGHDISAVGGIAAMTTLPYTLKLVWGPIIDSFPSRRFGRRRPWIVFAQAMMGVTVGVMILVPDLTADVQLLAWMIFIHTVFNAMQDVAVDGLAVDLLDEAERGRTNGFMYASKWGGGMLGGWGMAHLIHWFDLRTALVAQVSVLLAIMLLPLFVRERDEAVPPRPPLREIFPALATWTSARWGKRVRIALEAMFAMPGWLWRLATAAIRDPARSAILVGVVMLGSNLAAGTLSAVAPVLFTHELRWDPDDYTSLASGPGLIAGLAGSVIGGLIADKFGHRKVAGIAMFGLAGGYALWALLEPYWHSVDIVYATFWIEPLCQGVMTVSLFALCMDVTWPRIAASQFAAYMAVSNLSSTFGAKIAGRVADLWTYRGIYLVAAVVQITFVIVLPFIDPRALRTRDRRTP